MGPPLCLFIVQCRVILPLLHEWMNAWMEKNIQSRTLTCNEQLCGLNLALEESRFVYQPWKGSSERVEPNEAQGTSMENVGPCFQLPGTSLLGPGGKPTIPENQQCLGSHH